MGEHVDAAHRVRDQRLVSEDVRAGACRTVQVSVRLRHAFGALGALPPFYDRLIASPEVTGAL